MSDIFPWKLYDDSCGDNLTDDSLPQSQTSRTTKHHTGKACKRHKMGGLGNMWIMSKIIAAKRS